MISFPKNQKGFTLIELIIVFGIISILASIAFANYYPFKQKVFDKTALSDARNLVNGVIDAALGDDDIDFDTGGAEITGPVGNRDNAGNPRKPVITLSSGVVASIAGSTDFPENSGNTVITAFVSHPRGTPGKKFMVMIDEDADIIILQ